MVSVDNIIVKKNNDGFHILLIKRKNDPDMGCWALPGGFVDENEALELAAKRELKEETNLENIELKQFAAYGDPGRDPRGHVVSIIYYCDNFTSSVEVKAGDDASELAWFNLNNLPSLAFDHDKIVNDFKARHILKKKYKKRSA